jgi:hypothetical protein
VVKIFPVDFDPGIEGGVQGGCGFGKGRVGEIRRGMERDRQRETGFEKGAARVFHRADAPDRPSIYQYNENREQRLEVSQN